MPLTDEQVIAEIGRHGDHAHDPATRAAWSEIDRYYRRENDIELPEAVMGETGDYASLKRLFVHVNFTKTIVNASVTMALGSGLRAFKGGLRDEAAERAYEVTDIRKLLRYASKYGAAWLQVNATDPVKRYRVYKPHVARRLMQTEDPEREAAVLVVQRFERHQNGIGREAPEHPPVGVPDPKDDKATPPEIIIGTNATQTYYVARFYEWNDERTLVVRRDFVREGTTWKRRMIRDRWEVTYPYQPWVYVPNRIEDSIPEQSDVIDGLGIVKQYDALLVKYLKGLEDEAFRLIFLASVGDDVAKRILKASGLNFWHAKNKAGEPPPELQSVPPADQRQFLEGLKDLVNSLATATRTSVLELNERPVDDIPAQTLRVLYGPQIERVTETVEHVNPALSEALRVILGYDVRVELKPRLPVSEDKVHQNLKGLVDSKVYSGVQMLIDLGHTKPEAERIYRAALDEYRERVRIDAEAEVLVEQARAEAAAANRPPPGGSA